MTRDRLGELEARLFDAARAERPGPELEARLISELESGSGGVGPRQRTRVVVSCVAALAVAAATWLALGRTARAPLTPEPESWKTRHEEPAASPSAPPASASLGAKAASSGAPPSPPARVPPATLSEEVRTLDRARAALATGNSVEALRLLDEHARRAPNGRLLDEATLLRIEALQRAGRKSEAVALAGRFVKRNPNSSLADRARKLAEATDAGDAEGSPKGEQP